MVVAVLIGGFFQDRFYPIPTTYVAGEVEEVIGPKRLKETSRDEVLEQPVDDISCFIHEQYLDI